MKIENLTKLIEEKKIGNLQLQTFVINEIKRERKIINKKN